MTPSCPANAFANVAASSSREAPRRRLLEPPLSARESPCGVVPGSGIGSGVGIDCPLGGNRSRGRAAGFADGRSGSVRRRLRGWLGGGGQWCWGGGGGTAAAPEQDAGEQDDRHTTSGEAPDTPKFHGLQHSEALHCNLSTLSNNAFQTSGNRGGERSESCVTRGKSCRPATSGRSSGTSEPYPAEATVARLDGRGIAYAALQASRLRPATLRTRSRSLHTVLLGRYPGHPGRLDCFTTVLAESLCVNISVCVNSVV